MYSGLELWGGIEASVVRLAEGSRDQCADTGHDQRLGDLDLIAALGIRTLRYPFLWEKCAPDRADKFQWEWCDGRAARMRELGISPIAGLLHHGSGPQYTDLAKADFPLLFERYAREVATRFPWIDKWTPINEPLTTARFSGLYAIWYPHARDEGLFWKMLLNQVDATRLAMKAIRRVRADAELIQTEDLGSILSTPECAAEAQFQNHRRWLTWDLQCGRVTRGHPLWERIAGFGHGERLKQIAGDPCLPDVLGINHYLTSNRFLDGRGPRPNGEYEDLEAVRTHTTCLTHRDLLELAWQRYGIPLAITEVHNGCTRDEQLRWVSAAWTAAASLRSEGIPVRAVTLWALFGCQDWASLLTKREGIYEQGAFDIRGGRPRPTALAELAKCLASGSPLPAHLNSIVRSPGWWERDVRFTRAPVGPSAEQSRHAMGKPILIIGQGRLADALQAAAGLRGIHATRRRVPQQDRLEDSIRKLAPWAVINLAMAGDSGAVCNPAPRSARCAQAAQAMSQACARLSIPCVACSYDGIMDQDSARPYEKEEKVVDIHGTNKAEARKRTATRGGGRLIVGQSGLAVVGASSLSHFAHAILDLLIDNETGIWHLSNGDAAAGHHLTLKMTGAVLSPPEACISRSAMAEPAAINASHTTRIGS